MILAHDIKNILHIIIIFQCVIFSVYLLSQQNEHRRVNLLLASFLVAKVITEIGGVFWHFLSLKEIISESGMVVGYGASARSSTLLNFCGIDTQFVSIIADQNPLKHKHYTAGTHIPIDSPEIVMKKNPKYVFILAWNFTDEIIKILKDKFNYRGKYLVPS